MFKFLEGLTPGGFLLKLLPYGLAVAAVVLGYNYIYDKGYSAAQVKCNAAALQSRIDAQDILINNLKKQVSDEQIVLTDAQDKKQVVIKKIIEAKQVVDNNVKDNSSCDINADVISVLNHTRQTTGNSN
jgi:hypothetical protein